MQHRIIIIATTLSLLAGCKPPEEGNSPPVNSAGNSAGGTGSDDDDDSDSSAGTADDTGTTGEDFPCGEGTYLHECAFVLRPWYVANNGSADKELGELRTLNNEANPKLCFSSEASGGSSPAQHVAGGLVCGGVGLPSEQACEDLCTDFDVADIVPAKFEFGELVYTYDHHDCDPYDAGAGIYDGTCAAPTDGAVTITNDPCTEEYCEEPEADSTAGDSSGGQELDCSTWDTHGNVSTSVRGRTYEVLVDESWADHLILYPEDAFMCDPGFYDWSISPHKFQNLLSSSFWYAAGLRTGDRLQRAWEHDANHDPVPGTTITILDFEDGMGLVNLLPATGADLALTFEVKRGLSTYTFHLDPR